MRPTRILVVDDEPDFTALLSYILAREGHVVAAANTGVEAIQQVQRERPDIVLLDLMLPDLDGFGICEILRGDPATATIPIVIVSGWSSDDSRELGLTLGALDYIVKPVSPKDLIRRVNHFAALRA